MIVDAHVTINGSKAAIWAAINNIEHAAELIRGIKSVEILERPANGLVGLTWRETRILFGKPATVKKWIIDAAENQFYTTRAEDTGFVFFTTKRIGESGGAISLAESHETKPQSLAAKLQFPMLFLFKGVVRTALLKDLNDVKAAVERA